MTKNAPRPDLDPLSRRVISTYWPYIRLWLLKNGHPEAATALGDVKDFADLLLLWEDFGQEVADGRYPDDSEAAKTIFAAVITGGPVSKESIIPRARR